MLRKIIGFLMCSLVLGGLYLLWEGLATNPHSTNLFQTAAKNFPEFQLMDIRDQQPIIHLKDLKGKTHVVHVWGTWCGICVREHPVLVEIKQQWPDVSLVGILYRDDDQLALKLLKNKGDPYQYLLHDAVGNLGLDLGIVGTPETYIVDRAGVIRFHHQGAISKKMFEEKFYPLIQSLEKEPVQ
jgi:cytochrome c biogenesis protein CcmG/thiol:disulfide interchange protein DsbE